MSSIIKPAKKIVVLERVDASALGIKTSIIVASDKQPEIGKVIAIGTGKLPVSFKVGDIIIYRKYGETAMFIGSAEYLFVSFADVLAVKGRKK